MQESHQEIQYENLLSLWEDYLNQYCREEISLLERDYPQKKSIIVSWSEISSFNSEFADNLLFFPQSTINAGIEVLEKITALEDLHIRVIKLNPNVSKIPIREIREVHLNKFIAVEGLVRRTTDVRPKIKVANFKCSRCEAIMVVEQETFILKEPYECSKENGGCGKSANQTSFKLIEENSKFIDTQRIEIQEYHEGLRGGAQPQRLFGYCEDDITGKVLPGNRVILNGILRANPKQHQRAKSTMFEIFLEINSYEIQEQEYEEVVWTQEDEKKIIELSKDELLYEKIAASISPSIHGLEMEKLTLALQLFGGISKELPDKIRIRGDIHLLLVGDPGTAKSQLLRTISKLALRGIYASGKSSSAAGLTAAAMRDDSPFGEGRFVLEAGALVLADKGTACIDEMDKMTEQDRSSMHEAMEQQSISVAKAGITATLHSRCSILGAANPKLGRFEEAIPIAPQVNMPPTLLSRFDSIFAIVDKPNVKKDEEMAEHILRTHLLGEEKIRREEIGKSEEGDLVVEEHEPPINAELLRKYIAYARRKCFPRLTKNAFNEIKNYYVDLRRTGGGDSPLPITPRQLESFVRLAEASARARLSNDITKEDAQRAINIVEYSLKGTAFDFETQRIDIDKLASGITHAQRDRTPIIREIIREICRKDAEEGNKKGGASEDEIISMAKEKGIEEEKTRSTLKRLKDIEWYCPKYGIYRLVK